MTRSRIPGPIGLKPRKIPIGSKELRTKSGLDYGFTMGLSLPKHVGLHLGLVSPILASPKLKNVSAKAKVLILIGNGQDTLKEGVRYNDDKYFDQAAKRSLAKYTKDHEVVIKHVNSAKKMKELIEGGKWNKVIYFGHGVLNQMALAPDANGTPLKIDEFAKALSKAKVKKVYLFGCRAGYTGLARHLSKKLKVSNVYGTFSDLDVNWVQKGERAGITTNKFEFKEPLTEYTNGFQTKDGKKTKKRREERNDPININNDPLSENPMVDQ